MKCEHCGAEMKKGTKVCPECGMNMGQKSRRGAIADAMARAKAKVKDTDNDNA